LGSLRPTQAWCTVAVCSIGLLGATETGVGAATSLAPKVAVHALALPGEGNVELTSVSCVDPTHCVAVGTFRPQAIWNNNSAGEHPVIMRFDGRRWSTVASPDVVNAELNGVACVSLTACVAVGDQAPSEDSSSTFIEEEADSVWTVVPSPNPAWYTGGSDYFLEGVSCVSSSDCTAVGSVYGFGYGRGTQPSTGLVERESAIGWTVVPLAPLVPTPIPPASTTLVPYNALDPTLLTSVSCSQSNCIAVGEEASVATTAASWASIKTSPLDLSGVSCTSELSCVAVGEGGPGVADHTAINFSTSVADVSGSQWQRVSSPNTMQADNSLRAVSCSGTGSCVAIGQFSPSGGHIEDTGGRPIIKDGAGGPLIEVERQRRWFVAPVAPTPLRIDDMLNSVSCPSPHSCVAVGESVVNADRSPSGLIQAYAVRIDH